MVIAAVTAVRGWFMPRAVEHGDPSSKLAYRVQALEKTVDGFRNEATSRHREINSKVEAVLAGLHDVRETLAKWDEKSSSFLADAG